MLAELDRRAWGRTEPLDGARASTPLRFQGQYEDAETGLFYNRFRYYDPAAGLYLSPDPLGLDGGLRAYGYGDNPTGWIDPLGLLPLYGPKHALHARADELHGMLNAEAQRRRTTAVVEATDRGGCKHTVVGSSEPRLDPKQRAALRPGEVEAAGGGHAEVTAMAYAKKQGWTPTLVAASRPICPPCASAVEGAGARPVSPLK